jgi:hypothetical protein
MIENFSQILESPMLRSIIGGVIIFVVGLAFLRKQLIKLVVLASLIAAAVYFYNQYK